MCIHLRAPKRNIFVLYLGCPVILMLLSIIIILKPRVVSRVDNTCPTITTSKEVRHVRAGEGKQ